GEGETGTQTVTVEAVSSMPSVIPNPTIIYGGGSTGQLRYEPLLNQFTTGGSPVTITVTVRDNEEPPIQTSQSFTVTVNSVNDPPTLNDILDLNLTEEGSPGNV